MQQKLKKEEYVNLLARSIFTDEEEEVKEAQPLVNLSEGVSKSHKTVNNFKQQKSNKENVSLVSNPCHKPLLHFKKQNTFTRKLNLKTHSTPLASILDYDILEATQAPEQLTRKIHSQPYKILDAKDINDDFYLNLVDWSSTNILAVALAQSMYIWNACTSQCQALPLQEEEMITGVAWNQKGSHLSVGMQSGQVQVWDVNQSKLVRTFEGHEGRVGACSWNGNQLATASRDRSILVRDVRQPNNYHKKLLGHSQEVCGLKWSFHDDGLLASGGNDNKLMIWNPENDSRPIARFGQHDAAVKALGWSPLERGLLASGGGTADQHIRFWDTQTLQPLSAINTGS